MAIPDPWPLRHLLLRTPQLELRPDDDAGLLELVEEGYRGIHPPDEMPFGVPFTDAPKEEFGRNTLQYHWLLRASLRSDDWKIQFLVRLRGTVIGVQGLTASDFTVTKEVCTGSWLGMRHQRKGYGTEMRAAVLAFAFDHLGARQARSSAWLDNPASLKVSEKLGYRSNGTSMLARRGRATTQQRLVLSAEDFAAHRPPWSLEVSGVAGVTQLLGLLTQN